MSTVTVIAIVWSILALLALVGFLVAMKENFSALEQRKRDRRSSVNAMLEKMIQESNGASTFDVSKRLGMRNFEDRLSVTDRSNIREEYRNVGT